MDPVSPKRPLSTLALVAFILSFLSLCWVFALVPLVLGIVALVTHPKDKRGKGLAIAAIVLSPVLALAGMLAVAVPNFMAFQQRAKASECSSNLRRLFHAEKSFFEEHQTYTTHIHELHAPLERGNRYAYFAATAGPLSVRSEVEEKVRPDDVGIEVDRLRFPDLPGVAQSDVWPLEGIDAPGIVGQCPRCSITLACAGHPGNKASLDVWSVSTEERTAVDGTSVPPGTPSHDVDGISRGSSVSASGRKLLAK